MFFSFINLGCTKNLVDTQFLLGGILERRPDQFFYDVDPFAEEVELVFLNTCGFISSGRIEMFQTIKKLLRKKKKICLLWCAVQYFEKLAQDAQLSDHETQEWEAFKNNEEISFLSRAELTHFEPEMIRSIKKSSLNKRNKVESRKAGVGGEQSETEGYSERSDISLVNIPPTPLNKGGQSSEKIPPTPINKKEQSSEKIPPTPLNKKGQNDTFQRPKNARAYTNIDLWFEYLKIAEGCNNQCSFCIIPKIRGKQTSLPIEILVKETKNLIANWAKEIILIAQDSTRYGIDLYGKAQLFELLEAIDTIEGDFHYRVLYLYPDLLTKKHLESLAKLKKFIPYFDLPLQHASPKILKAMGRFYNHEMTLELLNYIKAHFSKSFVRTNFIIGFPGETEEDFQLLIDFIKQDWFENIALFEYHDEPLALSSQLPDKVDPKIIRKRFLEAKNLIQKLQSKRVQGAIKEKIWTISEIRADQNGARRFAVRPFLHCPEIDEEDTISLEQILESFDGEELKLGSRIRYQHKKRPPHLLQKP